MSLIRLYKESDYSDILEISKHIWDGNDYLPRLINKFNHDSHCKPFVLEQDGRVVSIVNMNFFTPDFVWLEAMRTHPDYRNLGLATKLNEYLIEEAKKSNVKEVWLSTSSSNEATDKMLLKAGFQEMALLKLWSNSDEFDDKDLESYSGLIDGNLKHINYLELYLTDNMIEMEKAWRPVKDMDEIKSILKANCNLKQEAFPYLVSEFNIFPIDSYFVDSWLHDHCFYINDQTNSIMIFKPATERVNSYVVGIYDFQPDVVISALYYGFNQMKKHIENDKTKLSEVDIKLFYPKELEIELLDTAKIFRIMKKPLL